ncbi:MAG: PKD domain-containing protein [Bacteroidetes bacterium]|nr:PKD domain-containing protein [Bacteroidota bacterium]
MRWRLYILSCFALLWFAPLRATHIVGGELYYDCLGNNNYQVTLKVYRDCINGIPPFDDPASIGIFDAVTGALVTDLVLTQPIINTITSTISVPCYVPAPGSVCEEEAIYTTQCFLPPNTNGYMMVYQRCCRNATIVNLVNPGGQGSSIVTYIPPASVAVCNSSARYNNYPPIYLCIGIPLIFDHSATDPDGDSLAYELCAPYNGADQNVPMPQPPNPPPYVPVTYVAPYTGSAPMASNPALSCNVNSGFLYGTPTMLGTWVVAVCCKEYRNGQLLNVSMRDFQFTVLPCTPIPVTGNININVAALNCTGLTIPFQQQSTNASIFLWNFGDPTTQADTSNVANPTYTYPANGTYTVTLVINPYTDCSDTDQVVITVTQPPLAQFAAPPPQCIETNNFSFVAGGTYGPSATLNWNFGPNANIPTSTQPNPSGIIFNAPGTYPVTLTITENGCTSTATQNVIVYPMPDAMFNTPDAEGCVPFTVQFNDASITGVPLTYFWDFGDGNTSTLPNPSHTYTQVGVYDVMLIISATSGCVATDTFFMPGLVVVNPVPTAAFTVDSLSVSIFDPFITATDLSTGADSCQLNWGDGYVSTNMCNETHAYWNYGEYTITQIVWNEYGCPDTAQLRVEVRPEHRFYIPNTFTPNGDGLNDVFMPAIMGAEDYRFLIFDRWGELIFDTQDADQGWDGRYKGDKCQQDVYVWKVEYTNAATGEGMSHIGHVNLIR